MTMPGGGAREAQGPRANVRKEMDLVRLSRRRFVQGSAIAVASSMAPVPHLIGSAAARGGSAHGLSLFGDLKYGPDFPHFDYVVPNAPKGGRLHLATVDTYSTLNPFTLKGTSAAGAGLPFESLLEGSADEADAAYGLVAESVALAPDRRSVRFLLRPEARWHDGTPITARDVAFSFEILTTEGHPAFANQLAGVDRVETAGDREVTFHLADPDNRKLPLIVGGLSIVSEAYYRDRAFGETTMEPPLGSGAYRVAKVDPGRSVTYERVADYWAARLPLNVGRYNFETITYDYYRDRTVLVEALKAGEFDVHEEFTSKVWATQYDIPAVEEGWLIKDVLKDNTPSGVQAFFFNTRLPKFQDRRVREAFAYAFDFEWLNKNQFYGLYDRMASYFENSELAARGLPSEAELAFLEPHRGAVPEEVFTKAFVPPATDGSGNNRRNLRAARALLEGGRLGHEGTEARQRRDRRAHDRRVPLLRAHLRAHLRGLRPQPGAPRRGRDPPPRRRRAVRRAAQDPRLRDHDDPLRVQPLARRRAQLLLRVQHRGSGRLVQHPRHQGSGGRCADRRGRRRDRPAEPYRRRPVRSTACCSGATT